MRHALFVFVALAFASVVSAQTPSFKLQWDQAEALPITSTLQYTLKIDTAPAAVLAPVCVSQGTGSRCTVPLAALASGQHTLLLTAFNGFGSTPADPLTGAPPSKPTLVTVTITITVP